MQYEHQALYIYLDIETRLLLKATLYTYGGYCKGSHL